MKCTEPDLMNTQAQVKCRQEENKSQTIYFMQERHQNLFCLFKFELCKPATCLEVRVDRRFSRGNSGLGVCRPHNEVYVSSCPSGGCFTVRGFIEGFCPPEEKGSDFKAQRCETGTESDPATTGRSLSRTFERHVKTSANP